MKRRNHSGAGQEPGVVRLPVTQVISESQQPKPEQHQNPVPGLPLKNPPRRKNQRQEAERQPNPEEEAAEAARPHQNPHQGLEEKAGLLLQKQLPAQKPLLNREVKTR